jgi:hypothetical protein
MPGSPQSISPPWNESDSFRETTLHLFDDPADRQAVRHMGRVLYDLTVETTRNLGGESMTRVELRAVAADLRYTGGYLLHVIRRAAKECSLDESDERLARFAGKLARRVGAIAAAIEGRLS